MATVFAITTPTDVLKLDADGHAEASFTVTNNTARPLRGLAKTRPLGDTKREWLKISGEPERDLAPGGTQQYNVTLSVPADASPGKYSFRLDVVSASNPDEDYTEGPTVTAEVLPAPPKPPSKAWVIPVALAAVLLIVGLTVWYVSRPKKVTVPAVANDTLEDAEKKLTDAKLKFEEGTQKPVRGLDVKRVESTDPKAGEEVAPGTTVKLAINVPDLTPVRVVVPQVAGVNLSFDDAQRKLNECCGLKAEKDPQVIASQKGNVGDVVVQSEVPGSEVDSGKTVKLTLKGPTAQVPKVIGQTLLSAMSAIEIAKLVNTRPEGEKLDGAVVSSVPAQDTYVLEGTKVTLRLPNIPCVTPICLRLRDEVSKSVSFGVFNSSRLTATPSPTP
jgi:beta-lactam-binding protein with PASTA domain